ncbi:hypothetical protein HID58_095757 [Brassica napus]|uniref:Uncharacterized protein n=1 Tax=Brassica napus TaxID=3708 RepID=A0ABQ7X2I2_BRANA|nr:hypothetical protein HID58_095757 [Brassica napus]
MMNLAITSYLNALSLQGCEMLRRFHSSSVPGCLMPTRTMVKLAILQVWQAAIYELCKERNRRLHDGINDLHYCPLATRLVPACRSSGLIPHNRRSSSALLIF